LGARVWDEATQTWRNVPEKRERDEEDVEEPLSPLTPRRLSFAPNEPQSTPRELRPQSRYWSADAKWQADRTRALAFDPTLDEAEGPKYQLSELMIHVFEPIVSQTHEKVRHLDILQMVLRYFEEETTYQSLLNDTHYDTITHDGLTAKLFYYAVLYATCHLFIELLLLGEKSVFSGRHFLIPEVVDRGEDMYVAVRWVRLPRTQVIERWHETVFGPRTPLIRPPSPDVRPNIWEEEDEAQRQKMDEEGGGGLFF
jgi:hypothetical protein